MTEKFGPRKSARGAGHQPFPCTIDSAGMKENERAGEVKQGEGGRVQQRRASDHEQQMLSTGSGTKKLPRAATGESEGGESDDPAQGGDSVSTDSNSNAKRRPPTATSNARAGTKNRRRCNSTPTPSATHRGNSTNDNTDIRCIGVRTLSDFPESNSSGSGTFGYGSIGTSLGSCPYSSPTISGEDDDTTSWMREGPSMPVRVDGTESVADVLGAAASGCCGFAGLGGDGRGSMFRPFLGRGGVGGGRGSSEETSSSSSATFSLQLPFSEDDAALMDGLGNTCQLKTGSSAGGGRVVDIHGGDGVGGKNVALLAGQGQQKRIFVDGLPAEAVRVRVLELNEELTHLDRHRRSLEGQLTQERARHEEQVAELERRWLEQINNLKQGQEALEIERDTLDARLRDKKDIFKDLEISDALARELRRTPEDDMTVKEYVSVKTYELVALSKGDLERTRRELEKTHEQLLATTEAGELQRREDARARRLATAREEGLKVDLEALRERTEEVSGRAREAQRAATENEEKARRFGEVEAQLRTARLELEAARALSKNQAEALVDVAETEKTAARNAQEALQRSAILEMDKTYLQRELSEAQSKADRLGREAGATADRLRDLERAKDNFAVELATVRERARSEHEDRLEAEVGRIREQSARELGEIRNNGREVIERENKALREGRIDALQECTQVRSQLSELQRAHEDLVISMAKSDAAHETTLGELRGELRLKGFELSQLGVAHAEKCSVYRQAELEMDMLRDQVNVHRAEFAALEASTTRKISELQLLLAAERDKVRAFEDLELEVDGAVMRTGRELIAEEDKQRRASSNNDMSDSNNPTAPLVAVGEVSGASGAAGGVGGILSGSGDCPSGSAPALVVPMAPHRRLRQAVLLAQKLLRKEGELEAARKELIDVEQRSKMLEARAMRAEGLLANVEQPTKYMVDSIRDKEGKIVILNSRQRMLVAKVEALEKTCRETGEENASLAKQMAKGGRPESVNTEIPSTEAGTGGGNAPSNAPSRFAHAREAMLPPRVLSEKLTVHEGRRMAEGGPRWYSYRQPKLIRVPL